MHQLFVNCYQFDVMERFGCSLQGFAQHNVVSKRLTWLSTPYISSVRWPSKVFAAQLWQPCQRQFRKLLQRIQRFGFVDIRKQGDIHNGVALLHEQEALHGILVGCARY